MSESFAALLDESLSTLEMQPGSIVTGVVLDVDKEWVTVHVGLKSEGIISLDEFRNNDGSIEKRIISYRKSNSRGNYQNPYLKDGDLINFFSPNSIDFFALIAAFFLSPIDL